MTKFISTLAAAVLLAASLAGCGVVADLAASASPKNKQSESSPVNTAVSEVSEPYSVLPVPESGAEQSASAAG